MAVETEKYFALHEKQLIRTFSLLVKGLQPPLKEAQPFTDILFCDSNKYGKF